MVRPHLLKARRRLNPWRAMTFPIWSANIILGTLFAFVFPDRGETPEFIAVSKMPLVETRLL
jgi:hypothetical protein